MKFSYDNYNFLQVFCLGKCVNTSVYFDCSVFWLSGITPTGFDNSEKNKSKNVQQINFNISLICFNIFATTY